MLEQKVVEMLSGMEQAIGKVAPQALELALKQQMWAGLGCIVGGFAALLIGLILIWLPVRVFKEIKAEGVRSGYSPDQAATVVCCIPSGIGLLIALINLLNIWNWVAIFDPKTALFHELVSKLLQR